MITAAKTKKGPVNIMEALLKAAMPGCKGIKYVYTPGSGHHSFVMDAPGTVHDGYKLVSWQMAAFPSCCGTCIIHNMYSHYPNKGLGTLAHVAAEIFACADGYTEILCTDKTSNTHEIKILDKLGYKRVSYFKNRRTSNLVGVFAKEITADKSLAKQGIFGEYVLGVPVYKADGGRNYAFPAIGA